MPEREADKYFYEGGRRLLNEYADGRIKIHKYENGNRVTDIQLAEGVVTLVRGPVLEISSDYGQMYVQKMPLTEVFNISRPFPNLPLLVVWRGGLIVGPVEGNRFDLALAYNLGVRDEELVKDLQETRVDPNISQAVSEILFAA